MAALVALDDITGMYDEIKASSLSGDCSVLVLVAADCDAVCAARIFTVSTCLAGMTPPRTLSGCAQGGQRQIVHWCGLPGRRAVRDLLFRGSGSARAAGANCLAFKIAALRLPALCAIARPLPRCPCPPPVARSQGLLKADGITFLLRPVRSASQMQGACKELCADGAVSIAGPFCPCNARHAAARACQTFLFRCLCTRLRRRSSRSSFSIAALSTRSKQRCSTGTRPCEGT